MSSNRWIRTLAGTAALAVAAIAAVPPSIPGGPSVSAGVENGPGAGGEYHPVAERRIFDSRVSEPTEGPVNDAVNGPIPTGTAKKVQVLGLAGVPADPAQVLAVAANVTITLTTVDGFAEVYPTGSTPVGGRSSLVNYLAGTDVSNMVITGVGDDGTITVKPRIHALPGGTVHVIVDVFGWISKTDYVDAADSGARLIALDSPRRMFDHRPAEAPAPNHIGPGESMSLQVRGRANIPNSPDVTGVVINLTVDNSQLGPRNRNTFVTAQSAPPAPGVAPATSTTNVRAGRIKANLAVVPIGADGKIHFYNSAGDTQLIVDAFGYLEKGHDETTFSGRIIPLADPFRAFDTRQDRFQGIPLGFGGEEDWSFWCFADSVTVSGKPVNKQSALIGNVTGTQFNRLEDHLPNDTFLKLYPRQPERPITSNINMYPGTDVPNMALVGYGDGDPNPDFGNAIDPYMVRAYNFNGSLHYLLDVFAIVLSDEPAPPIPPPSDPNAEKDYCGNDI